VCREVRETEERKKMGRNEEEERQNREIREG
jgi:hypothetical protein